MLERLNGSQLPFVDVEGMLDYSEDRSPLLVSLVTIATNCRHLAVTTCVQVHCLF